MLSREEEFAKAWALAQRDARALDVMARGGVWRVMCSEPPPLRVMRQTEPNEPVEVRVVMLKADRLSDRYAIKARYENDPGSLGWEQVTTGRIV